MIVQPVLQSAEMAAMARMQRQLAAQQAAMAQQLREAQAVAQAAQRAVQQVSPPPPSSSPAELPESTWSALSSCTVCRGRRSLAPPLRQSLLDAGIATRVKGQAF